MIIHTVNSLRANRRRVERQLESAELVLTALRRGAALHLQYAKSGPQWTLSSGHRVDDDVARMVVASSSVVGVGDALFNGAASQTFRWWADVS